MRTQVHIVENDKIGKLLSKFRISQGELYHYTDSTASENIITNKEIYLTRADHFLDKSEIQYGITLLTNAAEKILIESDINKFQTIIDALSERFKQCFIICFTQISNSKKHIKTYGKNILQFKENFPSELANMSRHSIPKDNGYSLRYSTDLYETIEGFVEYNSNKQKSIANEICEIFQETNNANIHLVDQYHFINAIMKFVILCKESCNDWEKEYRVGLISNSKWDTMFENSRNNGKIFIKLITPSEIKELK